MSTNKTCAARIRKVIDHYNTLSGLSRADGAETSLADLIADIMHFCKQKDLDFDDLLRRANGYFAAEVQGTV
jgi:hypothetical protein